MTPVNCIFGWGIERRWSTEKGAILFPDEEPWHNGVPEIWTLSTFFLFYQHFGYVLFVAPSPMKIRFGSGRFYKPRICWNFTFVEVLFSIQCCKAVVRALFSLGSKAEPRARINVHFCKTTDKFKMFFCVTTLCLFSFNWQFLCCHNAVILQQSGLDTKNIMVWLEIPGFVTTWADFL